MKFEVERKFRLGDESAFRTHASRHGLFFERLEFQVDTYYGHPCRSFGETDEALRIRRSAGRCSITYKGPKTDASSKTRKELDVELSAVDPEGTQFDQLLTALGFFTVVEVKKSREECKLRHAEYDFTVCLDHAETLGWYVEIETIAAEDNVPGALKALDSLAAELNLTDNERRSYLELVLQKSAQ